MANKESQESLFKRLTRLFKSGPVVRRKVKALDTMIAVPDKTKSSGALLFQKSMSPTYASITSNAYNLSERLMRYQDFVEMELTPEIAAALDIYADEITAADDRGRSLHVFSENERIKEILEELFYGTLNCEFNLRHWSRNLCKFGDLFLLNDIHPNYGVVNTYPVPVNEIEREENYDRDDPSSIRFRWVSLGNRVLENWEISHFRLLGNDSFLPYGSSIIEPARRIWRQLILIEDAMLVYRVVRAPERRVFYVDVANVAPEDVPLYMQEQMKKIRSSQVVDNTTGRVDLRYNPMSIDEDYWLPVRGSETGTKIETLQGGQNTAAVEDVAYIQRKLFAALKIPRAYLGYEEALSSKASLAQLDIRFSRTISAIQKTLISELNKIAIIHLFANGYSNDDLVDFTLRLSNPSTVAQQQKLELWRSKFDIAGTVPEGYASKKFVYKNVWGLTDADIDAIEQERIYDKKSDASLELITGEDATGGGEEFNLGGGEEAPAEEVPAAAGEEAPAGEENAAEEPPEEEEPELELLTSDDSEKGRGLPIKGNSALQKNLYNQSRRRHHGASQTFMPDLNKMTSSKDDDSVNDPYDSEWISAIVSNPMGESSEPKRKKVILSGDVKQALKKMKERGFLDKNPQHSIISEGIDVQDDIDALTLPASIAQLVEPNSQVYEIDLLDDLKNDEVDSDFDDD